MDCIRVAERPLSEDVVKEWREQLQEAKSKGFSHTKAVNLISILGDLRYHYSGVLADNSSFDEVFIYSIQNYEEIPKGWNVPEEKKCDGFYLIEAKTPKYQKIRIACNTVTQFTHVYVLS